MAPIFMAIWKSCCPVVLILMLLLRLAASSSFGQEDSTSVHNDRTLWPSESESDPITSSSSSFTAADSCLEFIFLYSAIKKLVQSLPPPFPSIDRLSFAMNVYHFSINGGLILTPDHILHIYQGWAESIFKKQKAFLKSKIQEARCEMGNAEKRENSRNAKARHPIPDIYICKIYININRLL